MCVDPICFTDGIYSLVGRLKVLFASGPRRKSVGIANGNAIGVPSTWTAILPKRHSLPAPNLV